MVRWVWYIIVSKQTRTTSNARYDLAGVIMNNPIKNTRKTYDRFLAKVITEVLVQFKDEDPAWIPLTTYEAIPGIKLTSEESRYWNGELEGEDFEKALNKYGYEYTPTSYSSIPSRF